MSISLYEGRIKQQERELKPLRKKRAEAVKKAAKLGKEISGLEKQARSTKSDSMRRSYLDRAGRKQRELERAQDEESKATDGIAKAESKLTDAKSKLADAQATAERRQADQDKRDQRQRERKEAEQQRRRERQEQRVERERAERDRERDHEIDVLQHRATQLEEKLAAAERRAAPAEITVLFLAASPEDQTPLRLDRETREIQKRLRASEYRESIWFEWRLARQLPDLIQDLNEVSPDVVHFSGHGDQDALVFEDGQGHTTELGNDQLGRLLDVGGGRIRLAIFNSCESETQATLARNHVDLAIGMNTTIGDEVAKTFAGQFYNSLGFGLSVAEAFRQAVLQIELVHGKDQDIPQLIAADGVDPETVVLVNPED